MNARGVSPEDRSPQEQLHLPLTDTPFTDDASPALNGSFRAKEQLRTGQFIRISALSGMDADPYKAPVARLGAALIEISGHLDTIPDPRRWIGAIVLSDYVSPEGVSFTGPRLLEAYARARFRQEHPKATIPDGKIPNHPEGDLSYCFRRLMREARNIEIPPACELKPGAVVDISNPAGFDPNHGVKNSRQAFDGILSSILDVQYADNFLEASVVEERGEGMHKMNYRLPGGEIISGKDLLLQYAVCRYEESNGPVTAKALDAIRKGDDKRFSRKEIFQTFLGERLVELRRIADKYTIHVESLGLFLEGTLSTRQELRRVVAEVFRALTPTHSEMLQKSYALLVNCAAPNGATVPLLRLLAAYSTACFREEKPELAAVSEGDILRTRGYSHGDIFKRLKKELLEQNTEFPNSFQEFSNEQFARFIDTNQLRGILRKANKDSGLLVELLAAARSAVFERRDVAEFVERYKGLGVDRIVERDFDGGAGQDQGDSLISFLIEAAQRDQLPLTEAHFQLTFDAFKRSLRMQFELDLDATMRQLKEERRDIARNSGGILSKEQNDFIVRLYDEALAYFSRHHGQEPACSKTDTFPYQREGIVFLRDRHAALLGDDTGLGKTKQAGTAAIERGCKRVLWVTTATNLSNVKNELLLHTDLHESDITIVSSESAAQRRKAIRNLGRETFRITNYETLVSLKRRHPEEFAKLTKDLDLIILDETHLTENRSTLRFKAVSGIEAKARWFLTATPWKNGIEGLWSILNLLDPDRFKNQELFVKTRVRNTSQILSTRVELRDIMLARSKEETVPPFEDPAKKPFFDQLNNGKPRIPTKRLIPPEQEGAWELPREFAETYAFMVAEPFLWAQQYNETRGPGDKEIELDKINPLSKFHYLQVLLHEPWRLGLPIPETFWQALDSIVLDRTSRGQKVAPTGFFRGLLDSMVSRYSDGGHGRDLHPCRLDGSVPIHLRAEQIDRFQKSPDSQLFVFNHRAGGNGVTISAADCLAIVQPPLTFTERYQVEGRNHRVIALNNIQHAKQFVDVVTLCATFPKGFVDGIQDPGLREILQHGTISEQTARRIEGGRHLYNLFMRGYANEEQLREYFLRGLFGGMGLLQNDVFDATAGLGPKVQPLARLVHDLVPVWNLIKGDSTAEECFNTVVNFGKTHPELVRSVAIPLQDLPPQAARRTLRFVASIVDQRNHYIREQLLGLVGSLMDDKAALLNLSARLPNLPDLQNDKSLLKVFPQVCTLLGGTQTGIVDGNHVKRISELPDTPENIVFKERFLSGILGCLRTPSVRQYLQDHERIISRLALSDYVDLVYRLGCAARIRTLDKKEVILPSSTDKQQLLAVSRIEANRAIEEFAGTAPGSIRQMLERDSRWRNDTDPLLGHVAGWCDFNDSLLHAQAREVVSAIIRGELQKLRRAAEGTQGRTVAFRKDDEDLWNEIAKDGKAAFELQGIAHAERAEALLAAYQAFKRRAAVTTAAIEGQRVKRILNPHFPLSHDELRDQLAKTRRTADGIGRAIASFYTRKKELPPTGIKAMEQCGISLEGLTEDEQKQLLRKAKLDLDQAVAWLVLEVEFKELEQTQRLGDIDAVKESLSRKIGFLRREGVHLAALVDEGDELARLVRSFEKPVRGMQGTVTVRETSHPADILRMGMLRPEMVNCFNPNGNPIFTQAVLGALASKNFKLLLAEDSANTPVAVAAYKVRRRSDDTPVLFLERGLTALPYNFRTEMLEYLRVKAKRVGKKTVEPQVATQIISRSDVKDRPARMVYGTGAYTHVEYAEAVHALRDSNSVMHQAVLYPFETASLRETSQQVVGVGFGRRSMDQYIAILKGDDVKVVVDVRENPYSQHAPHFNRANLELQLRRHGITYLWMGDTLGNPKDEDGNRSLDHFQEIMSEEPYFEGISRLRALVEGTTEGRVALSCSETKEHECHRKYILADLRGK